MSVNESYAVNEEIGTDLAPGTTNGRDSVNDVSVSFHEIIYAVDVKEGSLPCSKSTPKQILKNISGVVSPGLTAIMGPTGSGKTSLLDILAGRKDPSGIKNGQILFNGKRIKEAAIRLSTGYVVQDDILLGTLTVRENLLFSANLRLPSSKYSITDRSKAVEKMIVDLGLASCAETKIGNEFIRGISGGERKRVAIGMELITNPPVLFLDEPTTGLDAYTAASIIQLLQELGQKGRTVILSIHQPRYSIFSMFDYLMVLSRGVVVYNGTSESAVEYFSSIGYACPQYVNPADYLLDVVNGQIESSIPHKERLSGNKSDRSHNVTLSEVASAVDQLEYKKIQAAEVLSDLYQNSQLAENERIKLKEVELKNEKDDAIFDEEISHVNGFFHQLLYLLKRTGNDLLRYPLMFIGPIISNILVGVIVGLIFFQFDLGKNGIQDRAGAVFFIVTFHVMMNTAAIEIFLSKKKLFIHEKAGGYYRTSAYFFSRFFSDILALRWTPLIFLSLIVYFMLGFQLEVEKYFFFLLILALVSSTSTTMAFAISCSFDSSSTALLAMMAVALVMLLMAGFLVNIGSLLIWLEWIKWFSIFRYGINGLLVNEMSGLVFIANSSFPGFDPNSSEPCFSLTTNTTIPGCSTGNEYLDKQNIPHDAWGKWSNVLALGIMSCGFSIIALIKLRLMSIYK